ncbi:pentatricopeptide repeat-containing protein [Striga asiatica]|uniref:Pentatricopeptide repeat-containing protein n=1 Tax=Striga asiatica TaxID=4170 RepID=A0A5A7RBZ7_STRAF|nr:pentatricopeptide repeat-containing protein [Striga asiatica]
MYFRCRLLSLRSISSPSISNTFISRKIYEPSIPTQHYRQYSSTGFTSSHCPPPENPPADTSIDEEALRIQTLLRTLSGQPTQKVSQQLDSSILSLSQELVLNVLRRHRSEWKTAYSFFCWVLQSSTVLSSDTSIHNEILDILGRAKRFDEVHQVLDKMSETKNLINEHTFATVVRRYAAAHKVDQAIDFYNNMGNFFGLNPDPSAFQTLLLSLCRYKHVEQAENLLLERKNEFRNDIKAWNIILYGWGLLRSLPHAKRVWENIGRLKCGPDKYTYAIFINVLTKCGKTTTSVDLLREMWADEGCGGPDVPTCNTVIDGLCFKKRIPEALDIFNEMGKRGCPPNVVTYNTLIKHMCKIRRMDKVNELLSEMEEKGGDCSPDSLTFGNLLRTAKNREDVDWILERMRKIGCKMEGDTYILLLRLYIKWGEVERAKWAWGEMEREGFGPDRRSYTIFIHGYYDKGMLKPALDLFDEMVSKGMVPEPSTEELVKDMRSGSNGAGLRLRRRFLREK